MAKEAKQNVGTLASNDLPLSPLPPSSTFLCLSTITLPSLPSSSSSLLSHHILPLRYTRECTGCSDSKGPATADQRYWGTHCFLKHSLTSYSILEHFAFCVKSVWLHYHITLSTTSLLNVYVFNSLVPRPLPDFISQPWRKTGRRPVIIAGNGGHG